MPSTKKKASSFQDKQSLDNAIDILNVTRVRCLLEKKKINCNKFEKEKSEKEGQEN